MFFDNMPSYEKNPDIPYLRHRFAGFDICHVSLGEGRRSSCQQPGASASSAGQQRGPDCDAAGGPGLRGAHQPGVQFSGLRARRRGLADGTAQWPGSTAGFPGDGVAHPRRARLCQRIFCAKSSQWLWCQLRCGGILAQRL